jgi:aminomethyltransferase
VGEVTSGNFSPVLGRGVAMAFLPPDTADGEELAVDVRGRMAAMAVTKLPFVRR